MKKKYKFDYRIKTYAVRFHPAILPPWASHQRAKYVLPPRWYIIVFGATQDWPGPSLPDQTLPGQNLTRTIFFKTKGHWQDLRKWDSQGLEWLSNRRDFTPGRGTPCLASGLWKGNTAQECSAFFFFFFTVLYVVWIRWKTFIVSHHLVLNKFQHKFHLFICFLLLRSLVCLLELYTKSKWKNAYGKFIARLWLGR